MKPTSPALGDSDRAALFGVLAHRSRLPDLTAQNQQAVIEQEPTTPPPQSRSAGLPIHDPLPLRPRQPSTSTLDPPQQSPAMPERETDVLTTWAPDPPPQAPSILEQYTDALAAWALDPLLQPLPILEPFTDVLTTSALDPPQQSPATPEPDTDVLTPADAPITTGEDTPAVAPTTTCEDLPCGHAAEMGFPRPQIITHIHTHSAAILEFATRWENQYAGEHSFGARTIDRLSENVELGIVTAAMSFQMFTQMHCPEGPFPGGFPQLLRTIVRYFATRIRCLLHIYPWDSFFVGELELALRRVVGWVEQIVLLFDVELFEWS
ncbi:hypothetical protein LTR66_001641 [Elasticomyces elasticus]|nr:hypothetical protein LTR66_001641 [Elasticomyces elasticus]